MPNLTELSTRKDLLDEALSRSMQPEVRRDLATLRLATSLRMALREKFPDLDKAAQD